MRLTIDANVVLSAALRDGIAALSLHPYPWRSVGLNDRGVIFRDIIHEQRKMHREHLS